MKRFIKIFLTGEGFSFATELTDMNRSIFHYYENRFHDLSFKCYVK